MLVAEVSWLTNSDYYVINYDADNSPDSSPASTTVCDPCQQCPVYGHYIAYGGKDNTRVQRRCQ
jgi:hypothetical protein